MEDNREIPDTLQVLWEWDGPTLMTFTHHECNAAPLNAQGAEIEIRGTKGTLYLHGNRWEVAPEKYAGTPTFARSPVDREGERTNRPVKKATVEAKTVKGGDSTVLHARNFIECVRTRGKCNADILTGHLSTSATILGNIAHRMQSHLKWDGRAERFTNHAGANRHLEYKYRAPYKLS